MIGEQALALFYWRGSSFRKRRARSSYCHHKCGFFESFSPQEDRGKCEDTVNEEMEKKEWDYGSAEKEERDRQRVDKDRRSH